MIHFFRQATPGMHAGPPPTCGAWIGKRLLKVEALETVFGAPKVATAMANAITTWILDFICFLLKC